MARLVCRVVGCDPSWVLAVALGYTNRPVCLRCRRPI